VWSSRWNDWQGKPKYSDKTCSISTLSAINPTWPEAGSNTGSHGGKPVTEWTDCYDERLFILKIVSTHEIANGTS
jgi:hypothetical protein